MKHLLKLSEKVCFHYIRKISRKSVADDFVGDFLIMQIITILDQLQPYIKGGGFQICIHSSIPKEQSNLEEQIFKK